MEKEKVDAVTKTTSLAFGRRAFVKGAGFTGLGLAGATLVAGRMGMLDNMPGAAALGLGATGVHAAGITDTDILNFALNLEYLEAEFYTVATTGKRIKDFGIGIEGVGEIGPTEGGKQVYFEGTPDDDDDQKNNPHDNEGLREVTLKLHRIAAQITQDEQEHVTLLRGALGKDAVAKPSIDLDVLGIGFANFKQFLELARAFEDTGVSAYGGAAPLIMSKEYLGTAVRIGLTEALHSANLRLMVALNNVHTTPLDSLDVLPPPSGKQYFEVDNHALTVVRTTSQVLAIVYGSSKPGTTKGGFFPNGMNGNIKTV